MSFLSLLELLARVLPALSAGTVAVLHFTGADRHKTVAGQIAEGLKNAGDAADTMHTLLNGVPGRAAETTGGGP